MTDPGSEPPLVSVVMPTFNYGRFLAEAIESILGQTYRRLELVVVDDASTDDTPEVLRSFSDERLICIRREHGSRSGVLARNDGMAVARGALIAVADADDESLLHRLEHQVDFLDRNPDVCLLGGGMIRIDERGNPIDDPILSPIFDAPRKYREELLRGQGVMLHGAMMFRRRVLDRVKGYGAYTSSGDFEFILRASRYFQMHNLQEALIRRRVHEGSLTQTVGPTLRGYHHLLFTLREYQWLQREIGRLEKGKGSP